MIALCQNKSVQIVTVLEDVDTARARASMAILVSVSQVINPVLGVMEVVFAKDAMAKVKDSVRNKLKMMATVGRKA